MRFLAVPEQHPQSCRKQEEQEAGTRREEEEEAKVAGGEHLVRGDWVVVMAGVVVAVLVNYRLQACFLASCLLFGHF